MHFLLGILLLAALGPERALMPEGQRVPTSLSAVWVASDGDGAYAVGTQGDVVIGQRLDADGVPDPRTQTVLAVGLRSQVTFAAERYFAVTSLLAPVMLHAIERDGTVRTSITVTTVDGTAAVAADASRVLVAWEQSGVVRAAFYDRDLRPLGAPREVARETERVYSLTAAATGGQFAIAWAAGTATKIAHVSPDGDAAVYDLGVPGSLPGEVALAGGASEFLLVWVTRQQHLMAQPFSATLARLGPAWEVAPPVWYRSPRISYAAGEYLISWDEGLKQCADPGVTLHVMRATATGRSGDVAVAKFDRAAAIEASQVVVTSRGPLVLWTESRCSAPAPTQASHLPIDPESPTRPFMTVEAQRTAVVSGDSASLVGAWLPPMVHPDRTARIFRLPLPDLSPLVTLPSPDEPRSYAVASGGGRHLVAWSGVPSRVRVLDGNGMIVGGDELHHEPRYFLEAEWVGDRFLVIGDDVAAWVTREGNVTRFSLAGQIARAFAPISITPGKDAPLLLWQEEQGEGRLSVHAGLLRGTTVGPRLRLRDGSAARATFTGNSFLVLQRGSFGQTLDYGLYRIDAGANALVTPYTSIWTLRHHGAYHELFVPIEGTPLAMLAYGGELSVVDLEASLACSCLTVLETVTMNGTITSITAETLAPNLHAISYQRHGRVDERGVGSRAYMRLLSTAPERRRAAR